MFCPKCGGSNPDNGRYCRNCGADLGQISGTLPVQQPAQQLISSRGRPLSYERAITRIFTGFAFLLVAAILGITGVAGGRVWWFWMLIPAFGSLGAGVAQYMQIRNQEAARLNAGNVSVNSVHNASLNELPPQRTEIAGPESRYRTGDLVPPSVTDNTTRHLEVDKEGQTMTLPKK
jgi:hypothetical protein